MMSYVLRLTSSASFIMPLPHWVGHMHNALMAVLCLSVCLSVPCLTINESRTEGHRMLQIGRKKARDTDDP